MHICQKRGLHLDPQLFLDKSPIPVVEETKFLGVIFDRKLSFVPHLKYVKKRGLKAHNILKIIGNTEWGADRKVMLRLYRSCLGARRAKLSLQYASKIKSLPKHPAHNTVFDNKYMKLFDARPNAIRTFGLCIK